jgi:hypothetical protein
VAQRIEIADITIAAGVLSSAPQTFPLVWREGYPEFIEFRWPPGPSGLVGLQLLHSDRVIIPKRANTFLVTDDEVVAWPLEGFAYNATFAIRGYNTGVYPHTIQIRMGLNEVGRPSLPAVPILTVAQQVPSHGILGEGLGV